MKTIISILWLCLVFLSHETILGEIIDSSNTGFTVKHGILINGNPDIIYSQITANIDKWWDPQHTYSGNASNLTIEPHHQGCFCEKLPSKGFVTHMTVIYADPGKMLRMSGGLGPLQAMAVHGTLTITLTQADKKTKAEFTYTIGGYVPGGMQKYAVIVDNVLGQQWSRLKTYVETLLGHSDLEGQ
jgi:hypothetical protein